MSETYSKLAAALRERLSIIADRDAYHRDSAAHLERLKLASEKITALQAELPQPRDPQLAHFLDRCSYDKALALLEELERSASSREPAYPTTA